MSYWSRSRKARQIPLRANANWNLLRDSVIIANPGESRKTRLLPMRRMKSLYKGSSHTSQYGTIFRVSVNCAAMPRKTQRSTCPSMNSRSCSSNARPFLITLSIPVGWCNNLLFFPSSQEVEPTNGRDFATKRVVDDKNKRVVSCDPHRRCCLLDRCSRRGFCGCNSATKVTIESVFSKISTIQFVVTHLFNKKNGRVGAWCSIYLDRKGGIELSWGRFYSWRVDGNSDTVSQVHISWWWVKYQMWQSHLHKLLTSLLVTRAIRICALVIPELREVLKRHKEARAGRTSKVLFT